MKEKIKILVKNGGVLLAFLVALNFVCQDIGADENKLIVRNIILDLQLTFGGKKFNQPIAMLQAPNNNIWYVVEREGRVYRKSTSDALKSELFADLSDRVNASFSESGLLSMTFHPDFANNHYVYFAYTSNGNPLISQLSRFTVSSDGRSVIIDSEKVILSLPNLYDKHNITQIAFGPDNYMYIGFGDGHEGGGDPLKHGQNTNTLMAAMLRIDINKNTPYAIPSDNPFADGKGGKSEIYAWGFRNPWRWSFDSSTGDLWVSDVGEYHWEEINLVRKGGNYGWPVREGKHCYGSRMECFNKWFCFSNCPESYLADPVVDYSHDDGCAVIGGYVYRGKAIPDLQGVYLFSDACNGTIWGLFKTGKGYERRTLYTIANDKRAEGFLTVSFAEGNDGELYVIHYNGAIYKIVPGLEN